MILKHRDKELSRFEWIDSQGVRIVSVNESERRFLPLEMKGEVTDEIGDGSVKHTSVLPLAVQIKANLEADPFITYAELSELLHVPARTLARRMKELQSAGEIRRIGADKNGHWEVTSV